MTEEKIMEAINHEMDNVDIINLWNECVFETNLPGDEIFDNDETFFEETFSSPYDAVLAVTNGEYNECEKYIAFDGYDNVVTFDYWDDENSPIDIGSLVDWLMENPDKAAEIGVEDDDEDEQE